MRLPLLAHPRDLGSAELSLQHQGRLQASPTHPPPPRLPSFSFFYFHMPVDSVISQLDKLVRASSGKV